MNLVGDNEALAQFLKVMREHRKNVSLRDRDRPAGGLRPGPDAPARICPIS
ncbi:MAG: hypothetical protein R3E50_07185 [Halioglobus sp.]